VQWRWSGLRFRRFVNRFERAAPAICREARSVRSVHSRQKTKMNMNEKNKKNKKSEKNKKRMTKSCWRTNLEGDDADRALLGVRSVLRLELVGWRVLPGRRNLRPVVTHGSYAR
jgi:hypothetical protein